LFGIAAACVVATPVAGAAAMPTAGAAWSRPFTVSAPGEPALDPAAAADPQGDAVVVWVRTRPRVVLRDARGGLTGSFGPPTTVGSASLGIPGNPPSLPEVAIDRHGDVLAVWTQGSRRTTCRVVAAFAPLGHGFGRPVAISAAPAFNPQVAFDANGNAIVVWTYFTGRVDQAQSLLRSAHGSFGRVQDLSSATADALQPDVALAPSGAAVAVWAFGNSHQDVIQVTHRAAGGAFGTPQTVSSPAFNAENPEIAIDPAGRAVATWDQGNAKSLGQIAVAFAPSAGTFGAPQTLTRGSSSVIDYVPQVGIAVNGTARLIWAEGPPGLLPGRYTIRASTAPSGGPFGASQSLASSNTGLVQPALSVTATGAAFAAWTALNHSGFPAVDGAIAGRSTPFGAAQTLTSHGARGNLPAVAVGGHRAIAAWQITSGTRGIDAVVSP